MSLITDIKTALRNDEFDVCQDRRFEYSARNNVMVTEMKKGYAWNKHSPFEFLVGRLRLERRTNGLKVRCSTNWANGPEEAQNDTLFEINDNP